MATARVLLLDAPVVVLDERALEGADLGGPRVVRCMAVLAVQAGRSVSRDVLADALWEAQRPDSWRANLSNALSALRRTLDGLVVSTTDGYRLTLPRLAVDVLALDQQAADAEAGDAAAAWEAATRGLPPAGAVPMRGYDGGWSDQLRVRVAACRRRLVVRAAEAAIELGRTRDAQRLAAELVADSPLHEDGHRLLMQAHAVAADRAAALEAYEACRSVLAEQLGTTPDRQTESVFLELLREAPVLRPALSASAGPLLSAGRPERSVEHQLETAGRALAAGLLHEAAMSAVTGLAALDATASQAPRTRLRLEAVLGAARHQLGDPAGQVHLHHVIARSRELDDANSLADAALAFTASESASGEAAIDETHLDLYREALEGLAAGESGRRARLLGRIALALAWRTDHRAGRAYAEQSIELAEASGDPVVLASALCIARQTLHASGELRHQEQVESRLFALARELNDPACAAKVAVWAFGTAVGRGDGEPLERLVTEAAASAADVDAASVLHSVAYTRAAHALLRGDLYLASILIEDAASIGRRAGLAPHIVEAMRLVQLVPLWEATGRLAEHRDELVGFFGAAGLPEWSSMVAIAEAAAGDLDAAGEHIGRFLDHFVANGPSMIAPIALAADLARPVAAVGDLHHAERLYALLAPHAGQGAYTTHFAGPFDLALGVLARTTGREGTARAHFAAAQHFAERLGAPLLAARCSAEAGGPVVPDVARPRLPSSLAEGTLPR